MYSIGIDIGGTTIKYGLVDDNNEIIARRILKTTWPQEIKPMVDEFNEFLKENNLTTKDIDKVVAGCPGIVNSDKGTTTCPALQWDDLPLRDVLTKELGVKTEIHNDVNLATAAEVKFGSGKGYKNAVMLTLGTGVGAGIIIDGNMYLGNQGMGAEIGHMVLELNGTQCNCGRKGCFQAYASALALKKQAMEKVAQNPQSSLFEAVGGDLDKINGEYIYKEFLKGDKTTCEVVDKYIEYLSEGILSICNIFRPEVILLGGGISNWGDVLTDKIKEYCNKEFYGYKNAPIVDIKIATLKNDAGILGCKAV